MEINYPNEELVQHEVLRDIIQGIKVELKGCDTKNSYKEIWNSCRR